MRVDQKLWVARLVLFWERLWAALRWPIMFLALGLALLFSGLLLDLAPLLRLCLMLVLVFALLWSLRPLLALRLATAYEVMRRIERDSGLRDRPLSSISDSLPEELEQPAFQAIWQEHQRRQWQRLGALRIPRPRSNWRDADPMALRVPAALVLLVAFVLGPGTDLSALRHGLTGTPSSEGDPVIDAWLKPPAYTGRPPLMLTSPAMKESLASGASIIVPAKSKFSLHVQGARAPRLDVIEAGMADSANQHDKSQEKSQNKPEVLGTSKTGSDGLFQADAEIAKSSLIKIYDGDRQIASWAVNVLHDNPPTITLLAPPEVTETGAIKIKWRAVDDYGVDHVTSEIDLADQQVNGNGFSGNGVFLFDAPELKVSLRKRNARQESGTATADLTSHPWAGFNVTLTLTAYDGAGQKGVSLPTTFALPERQFTRLMARALIEQRKLLITDTENAGTVADQIDTMLVYPRALIPKSGLQIAIAANVSRLGSLKQRLDYERVVTSLWEIAIILESGDFDSAREQLDQARKALESALRNGASSQELQRLTDRLREAMNRYLNEMSRQAKGQQSETGPSISREDLDRLLDELNKMAQGGARDQAQQLLSELDRLMKNLRVGSGSSGGDQGGRGALGKLSELMKKQRKLMDDTQRNGQSSGQQGRPGQGQDSLPGDQGDGPSQGKGASPGGSLADQQGELQDRLNDLLGEMNRNGIQPPSSLGEAGRAMGQAEGNLGQGEQDEALGNQNEALRKLREGAQKLAQQLRGNRNGRGQGGEGEKEDPLGRPRSSTAEQHGPDRDMVPSEQAVQRVQEILRELRARSSLPGLPDIDRSYIERLLRGLY